MQANNNGILLNVMNYGAVGNGKTKDTKAIKHAVNDCSNSGGGTVYFPPGTYLTGSIELKDNVNLYVESGATILGSQDPCDYPLVTKEHYKELSVPFHSALITGHRINNVSVTGRGTLNGQGWNFWEFKKLKNKLEEYRKKGDLSNFLNEDELAEAEIAEKEYSRRPVMIQFIKSSNILIEGVTIKNSPFWTVRPIRSDNITICGITINNPYDSPNTDGINPEGCRNVHISNCHIDVGDDCITIKAGKKENKFLSGAPCENITVNNCTMLHGHGGVVIGSEVSGGIKNVTISNCVFNDTDRGIRIKTVRGRGGYVKDITISNIVMNKVICPFVMNMFYGKKIQVDNKVLPVDETTTAFENIYFNNIIARDVKYAGFLLGLPESPIKRIAFSNILIMVNDSSVLDEVYSSDNAPAMTNGLKAVKGFFMRNVYDIAFNSVEIINKHNPVLVAENASCMDIDGLKADNDDRKNPVIHISQSSDVFIRGCIHSNLFLKLKGKKTKNIFLRGNILKKGVEAVEKDEDVDTETLKYY